MIYLSAQPATDYYAWQVEVYLNNFLSMGIEGENIHVVNSVEDERTIPLNWNRIRNSFPTVNFYFYKDTRMDRSYVPGVQAHILKKHFQANQWLEKEAVFFHDSDFVFTKKFNFEPYLKNDVWYFSDTISYIGADYIKNKSKDLLQIMCDIVGVDREFVEDNQNNSGGAQKLIKNVDYKYWEEVEKSSLSLYKIPDIERYKHEKDPHPLQIWCASMWAELWTAWKLNREVRVIKDFDFCWATDPIQKWGNVYFYHNAGVTNSTSGMFYKGDYIDKLPYDTKLKLDKTKCSILYYKLIKKSAERTKLA